MIISLYKLLNFWIYKLIINSRAGFSGDTWFTLEHNHSISQVSSHDEIVLNHEGSFLGVQDIPVRGGLDTQRSWGGVRKHALYSIRFVFKF